MTDPQVVRLLEEIRDLQRTMAERQQHAIAVQERSFAIQERSVAMQQEAVAGQQQAIATQRMVVRRLIPALLIVAALVLLLYLVRVAAWLAR